MEIHPNAFATELMRIIAAKTGHRYWIIKKKIFFLRNGFPSSVTSSSIFFTPMTLETRRQVAIAAMGIITELVRKSKKSRNCMPMMVTFASGPYPRQDKEPRDTMITAITMVDFLRPQYNSSSKAHIGKYFWNGNKHQCRSGFKCIRITS